MILFYFVERESRNRKSRDGTTVHKSFHKPRFLSFCIACLAGSSHHSGTMMVLSSPDVVF